MKNKINIFSFKLLDAEKCDNFKVYLINNNEIIKNSIKKIKLKTKNSSTSQRCEC